MQNQKHLGKQQNVKCIKVFKEQCLSEHNSYACKLRYFNGRCLMALKLKEKEQK